MLIIVGIAFGLIAAAVVVNRRIDASEGAAAEGGADAEAAAEGGPETEAAADPAKPREKEDPMEPTESPETAEAEPSDSGGQAEPAGRPEAEPAEPAEAEPADSASQAEREPAEPGDAAEVGGAALGPSEPPTDPDQAPAGGLLGELHRDPASGDLIFRSGAREFRSAADITDRAEHDRLASAAADWLAWFEHDPKPAVGAPPASKASARAPQASAAGIVQAIDQILQRSLEQSGMTNRGVRLIQDLSGGVKVLIGVKSYEVEEVPDDEIRNLIRQAVAEWEGQQ